MDAAERMIEGNIDGSDKKDEEKNKVDYLGYLLRMLSQRELLGTEFSFEKITPYIRVTEEDNAVIDRMQNGIDNKEI